MRRLGGLVAAVLLAVALTACYPPLNSPPDTASI